MAEVLLGNSVKAEILTKIFDEIESSESTTADPETIFRSVELGILDLERSAGLLGYPEDAPSKAGEDHAARLLRIQMAQTPKGDSEINGSARGLEDFDDSPGTGGSEEKAQSRDNTTDAMPSSKVRGKEINAEQRLGE